MGGREEELCSVTRTEYIAIRWQGTRYECVRVCVYLYFQGWGPERRGGWGEFSFFFFLLKEGKRNEKNAYMLHVCASSCIWNIYRVN